MRYMGIVSAFLVLGIVSYILIHPSNQKEYPQNGKKHGNGFTIVKGGGEHQVILQAEDAKEVEAPAVVRSGDGPVLNGASGGKCVYIGPEKWNEKWKNKQVEGVYKKGHEEAEHPGYACYRFSVPATGDYVLWLRAFWVDKCANSVAISINGSSPALLPDSNYGRWVWTPFKNIEGELIKIRLEKGKTQSLTICNREDDVYFDQILLRDASEKWPEPTGIIKTGKE